MEYLENMQAMQWFLVFGVVSLLGTILLVANRKPLKF